MTKRMGISAISVAWRRLILTFLSYRCVGRVTPERKALLCGETRRTSLAVSEILVLLGNMGTREKVTYRESDGEPRGNDPRLRLFDFEGDLPQYRLINQRDP